MGGNATFSGTSYQAQAIAFVYTYVLSQMRLGWLPHVIDVPLAVSGETDGPGDDFQIEFESPLKPLEAQAKHGMSAGGKLDEFLDRVKSRSRHSLSGIALVVDRGSSRTIRQDFGADLERLRGGRRDNLKAETSRVIASLGSDAGLLSDLHVIEADVSEERHPEMKLAIANLVSVLEDESQATAAMAVLFADANGVCAKRLRRTRGDLLQILQGAGIKCRPPRPDEPWHRQLDYTRRLLQMQHTAAALSELRGLETALGNAKCEPRVRYRLHQQFASALLQSKRSNEALERCKKALDIDPDGLHALVIATLVSLQSGSLEVALTFAERACAGHPEDAQAWGVRLLALAAAGEAPPKVPSAVAAKNEYKRFVAQVAFDASDWARCVTVTEEILKSGERDANVLFFRGESLLRCANDEDAKSRELAAEAERLFTELIDGELPPTHPMVARALILRADCLERRGEKEASAADIRCAQEVNPSDPNTLHAAAQARLDHGDPVAALAILHSPTVDRVSTLLAFRAQLHASQGTSSAGKRDLDAALTALPGTDDELGARLMCAEAAISLGELDLAERVLAPLDPDEKRFPFARMLQGRIASRRGDMPLAEAAYRAAALGGEPLRSKALAEFAAQLQSRHQASAAVVVFREVPLGSLPESLLRVYAAALLECNDYVGAFSLVQHLRAIGPLPEWGLRVAVNVALEQEDVPRAIESLSELVSRNEGGPHAFLALAQLLIEDERPDVARTQIARALDLPKIDPAHRMRAAQLLFSLGDKENAMALGYTAFRAQRDDPEIHRAFIMLVLAQDGTPEERPQVVDGSYVRLQAADGAKLERFVFSSPPYDTSRGEVGLEDAAALGVLGKTVGDVIVFNEGRWNEKAWTVVEVLPAAVRAAQEAMSEYETRFPRADFFMSGFTIGDGSSVRDFAPFISTISSKQERAKLIARLQNENVFPLGFVAKLLGVTIVELMQIHEVDPEFGPLWVEWRDDASQEASRCSARDAQRVVLTQSSMQTAATEGFLDALSALKPLAPASLLKELRRQRLEAESRVQRGHKFLTAIEGRLHFVEFAPGDSRLVAELERLKGRIDWLVRNVELMPRPLAVLSGPESSVSKLRETIGDADIDAVCLATTENLTLYADDLGLRRIRFGEGDMRSCSTFTLLPVLSERGLVAREECDRIVSALASRRYVRLSASPELVAAAAKEAGSQGWVRLRSLVAAAIMNPEAVRTARDLARSLRLVAITEIQTVSVACVAKVMLDEMRSRWPPALCARLLVEAARDELLLVPRALAEVENACSSFLAEVGAGSPFPRSGA